MLLVGDDVVSILLPCMPFRWGLSRGECYCWGKRLICVVEVIGVLESGLFWDGYWFIGDYYFININLFILVWRLCTHTTVYEMSSECINLSELSLNLLNLSLNIFQLRLQLPFLLNLLLIPRMSTHSPIIILNLQKNSQKTKKLTRSRSICNCESVPCK